MALDTPCTPALRAGLLACDRGAKPQLNADNVQAHAGRSNAAVHMLDLHQFPGRTFLRSYEASDGMCRLRGKP